MYRSKQVFVKLSQKRNIQCIKSPFWKNAEMKAMDELSEVL